MEAEIESNVYKNSKIILKKALLEIIGFSIIDAPILINIVINAVQFWSRFL